MREVGTAQFTHHVSLITLFTVSCAVPAAAGVVPFADAVLFPDAVQRAVDFDSPTSGVPVWAALVALGRRAPLILRADHCGRESPNPPPAFFRELDRRCYCRMHYRLGAQEFEPARVAVSASLRQSLRRCRPVSVTTRRCWRSHREIACDRGRRPRRSRSLIAVVLPAEFSVCGQPLSRRPIASHRTSSVFPD